jgi:hypothetical protein
VTAGATVHRVAGGVGAVAVAGGLRAAVGDRRELAAGESENAQKNEVKPHVGDLIAESSTLVFDSLRN